MLDSIRLEFNVEKLLIHMQVVKHALSLLHYRTRFDFFYNLFIK